MKNRHNIKLMTFAAVTLLATTACSTEGAGQGSGSNNSGLSQSEINEFEDLANNTGEADLNALNQTIHGGPATNPALSDDQTTNTVISEVQTTSSDTSGAQSASVNTSGGQTIRAQAPRAQVRKPRPLTLLVYIHPVPIYLVDKQLL